MLVRTNSNFSKTLDGLMNEIFNELPSTLSKTVREDVLHFPPVNITEQEAGYVLELSAPGFEKPDFKVNLDGNMLTISTEKKEEKAEDTGKLIRREFSHKAFKRSFTIDEKIDAEKINARYENGILKLDLPKKEIAKPEAKQIAIQ
ncbi:MAG: Hsp20/alpha crystallin family protein [Ferruginibacter sp.]